MRVFFVNFIQQSYIYFIFFVYITAVRNLFI